MPGLRRLAPLLAAAAALACGANSAGQLAPAYSASPDAVTVTAAENFYGDLLHQLGGSRLRVYSILSDPNADPHQYESNAASARAVADSRLVIVNGLGYDGFMDRLLAASPRPGRVVVSVQAVVGAAAGANPHLWYDPTVMPRVAQAVVDALTGIDPTHMTTYRAGLAAFLSAEQSLSERVAAMRSRFAGAPVALTEPVFGYMADALGLDVRSPEAFMKAVEEGNDPSPQAAAEQSDLISRRQVRVLIYNRQTITRITENLRSLARRSGVPVIGVSETEPSGQDFEQWQLGQLDALDAALAKSA